MGVSASALSHTVRKLEESLEVRLLTRTTRSVSTTEAGARLLKGIGPLFDQIAIELEALNELRERPAGTTRISTGGHAAETILMPAVAALLPDYPAIRVEIGVDNGFVDIVAEGFDAGVRMGETIAQDMIAVPIGPGLRMAAVGSPAYFMRAGRPLTPHDVAQHVCINIRFPTHGGLYVWEFEKAKRPLNVRVDGQLVVNDLGLARMAALAGSGIAYLPEDYVRRHLEAGRLERVLEDWCPPFPGYHIYYPSRRQQSPALTVLLGHLRYRE